MSKCRNEIIASGSSIVPRSCPICGIAEGCHIGIDESGNATCKMIRGYSEAETVRLNGWGVGDILEGAEGNRVSRILITAVTDTSFLCKWDYKCNGEYDEESGDTILNYREWKKVGSVTLGSCDMLIEALRIAKKYLHDDDDSPTRCGYQPMYLCISPSEVSAVDTAKLESLSFYPDGVDGFISYKFGGRPNV